MKVNETCIESIKYIRDSIFKNVNDTIIDNRANVKHLKSKRYYLFENSIDLEFDTESYMIKCSVYLRFKDGKRGEKLITINAEIDILNQWISSYTDDYDNEKARNTLRKFIIEFNDSEDLIWILSSELRTAGVKFNHEDRKKSPYALPKLRSYLYHNIYPRMSYVFPYLGRKTYGVDEDKLYYSACELTLAFDLDFGRHVRIPLRQYRNNKFYNVDVILLLDKNHHIYDIGTDSNGFTNRDCINSFCHSLEHGDNGEILRRINEIISTDVMQNTRNAKIEELLEA